MQNEKYVNYYIETVTNTLTDTLLRNISLQVSARIAEESSAELGKMVQEYEQNQGGVVDTYEKKLKEKDDYIGTLEHQVRELSNMKGEYENTRHQINHLDTFRSELVQERDSHQKTRDNYEQRIRDTANSYQSQIDELKKQIDYLQLTPAKRKKIDEANKPTVVMNPVSLPLQEDNVKDGGSF